MIRIKSCVICLLLVATIIKINIAQDYSVFPIKEQYDGISKKIVGIPTIQNKIPDSDNGDYFGDRTSYLLMSLLRMYEITGDKAYLIRFISFSYIIQEVRNDHNNQSNHPGWVSDTKQMYQDGLIIMAMAEFVSMINDDNTLANTLLPDNTTLHIDSKYFPPYPDNQTYGTYATWLRTRIWQTLNFYTFDPGFWFDDHTCYTNCSNPTNETEPLTLNEQSPFASTLYYYGITDPNNPTSNIFLWKAACIANAYKGSVSDQHCVACKWNGDYDTRFVTELFPNNSYLWKDLGWRSQTCSNRCGPAPDDWEDLAHGRQSLLLPMTIYDKLETSGNLLFDDVDMSYYRNTFVLNVFDGYTNNCPDIHAGIDGDDDITYRDKGDYDGINNAIMIQTALAWMPLYKFDWNGTNVYDILMKLYDCKFRTTISNINCGLGCFGLSEVATAQWDKECPDLTLYNRRVVYDQDFQVKGNLTVDPTATSDTSYADPIITPVEFKFIIAKNVTTNMVSGKSIVFKPETYINKESNFHAYINPSICTSGNNFTNSNVNPKQVINLSSENFTKKSKKESSQIPGVIQQKQVFNQSPATTILYYKNSLSVSPNPFNEMTNINFSLQENCSVTIKIIDQYGVAVSNELNNVQFEEGNYSIKFNGIDLLPGLYCCILQINGLVTQTKKIVLIK